MKYILILYVLLSIQLYSQEKQFIYFNESYQEINEKEFLKGRSSREFLSLYFENDSLIQCLLIRRKKIGKLNKNHFSQLKEILSINDIVKNHLIVVIYYPGKDRCNDTKKRYSGWNIFDRDYLKQLNRINDISHHWIYKNDKNLKFYYQKK